MLAQAEKPTSDFFALARYLIEGRERPPSPDRVAWMFGHNLPDADPDAAARIMTATAALSRRCLNPCYHLMIAWAERERPTPEAMQEIAIKTLHLAGLADHQALIVGHGDKPHRHLHIMLNRVSPVDGRAWKTNHDWRLWDGIMRQLSDEYGFEVVPAHAFDPELTDGLSRKPGSRATYTAKRGAKTGRSQWSRRQARTFAERLTERLDQASTWDDLEMLFAEEGLALEAKGKGHVVGNAASYVKLSSVGLQKSAKGFEKRPLARRRPPSRPPRPIMDGVAMAKALAAMGLVDRSAVRDAVQEAQGRHLTWLARRPLIEQLLADLRKTLAAWTAHTPPKAPRKSSARHSSRGRIKPLSRPGPHR
ncbi:MAG: relaxase/mobilization nuclease domain-containing protein [Hyphomicrobiaceae bacterium]